MSIEIDFSYMIDGYFDSVNYYRSTTAMDPEAMPPPVASGITELSYTDATATKGEYYYVRFGAVRFGAEKISEEIRVLAGIKWTPLNLSSSPLHFISETSEIGKTGSKLISINNNITTNDVVFNQSSDSNRPIITTHSSGKRSITFNGTDQRLQSSSSLILDEFRNTGKAWAFIVLRKLSVDGSVINRAIIANAPGNSGGGGRFSIGVGASVANKLYLYSERIDGAAGTLVELDHIFGNSSANIVYVEVDFIAAVAKAYVDGTEIYNSGFGTSGNTSNTTAYWNAGIGAFIGSPPVVHCDMELLTLIQSGKTSTIPTTTEREKLEGWAAHNYSLLPNLPSGHPYKINPPVV